MGSTDREERAMKIVKVSAIPMSAPVPEWRLRQEIGLDPLRDGGRDGAERHWGPGELLSLRRDRRFESAFLQQRESVSLKNAMRPQPNAWLRSTIRSSGSSIPTEMRISAGVIPSRNRSSSGMSE